MHNKINYEILVQIIIELSISILLIIGLLNGKINTFVHPKFNLFLWMSAAILVFMAFISSFKLFSPKHMNVLTKYFIVIIPIIMCFYITSDAFKISSQTSDSNSLVPPPSNSVVQQFKVTEYKKEEGKDYVDITDYMFLKWYYDSTFNWGKYDNLKFKFLARVFKPTDTKDFVVLGRYGMVCCAADLQPCGFIYNDKGFEKLKDNEWYWVIGEVRENKKYTFNYEKLPQIVNIKLEPARKPTDEFVYIN